MKNAVLASFFAILVLFLAACNTQTTPPITNNETLIETQEFILAPEISTSQLQATSVSITATTPRLIVRLSIKPELNANGVATGKRYGQAELYWTDKARSKGGSNLGGIVSITLRDANVSFMEGSDLATAAAPVMSNIDLYKQPGYEDHIVKTLPVSFSGPLCIEVSGLSLLSTNGYYLYQSQKFTEDYDTIPVVRLCDKQSARSGVDLRLTSLKDRVFYAMSGGEFTFPIAVVNSGSSTAQNVTVNYKIPYAEELTFIRDDSGIFTCSALTTPTSNEGLVMNVSCYAPKVTVGIKTLPLIFSSTKEAAFYGVFEFYMTISTSSPETDITNNTADSFIVVY